MFKAKKGKNSGQAPRLRSGQAVLVTVVFLAVLLVLISSGLTSPLVRTFAGGKDIFKAARSYYVAESGSEDAAYRISHLMNYSPSYNLSIDDVKTTIIVTDSGNDKVVEARGDDDERIRTLSTTLNLTTSQVRFYYGIQVGDGGLTMSNNAIVNGNVYSNGSIIGSDRAKITGTAIVAGGISAEPSVEWAAHNADQPFATTSANRDIAQSFTAAVSDKLNRASVYLGKVGNPASNITVRIAADNGGKPNTSSLATAIIVPSLVGAAPSWINVAFASPPNLTAGSKYWIILDYNSDSGVNYWNWRKDTSDGYANNTGKYTSNCCSGNPTWTNVGGDLAFRVWLGGVNTKIEGLIIGDAQTGLGKANQFINTTIHGSACPNQYCVIDNPPREELPIPAGVIQDWRDDAAAGGVCGPPTCDLAGNFSLTGSHAAASLGPIQINGNVLVDNNATLTLTGTVWVKGNVMLSNGCIVKLIPGYGAKSGILLGDQQVTVSNNCAFQGTGVVGSYILLLSAKDAPLQEVMNISNNSAGVIYYASNGKLELSNNATAKEAVGYGIELENNAVINYESGLQNILFSSGPGASFQIKEWKEI